MCHQRFGSSERIEKETTCLSGNKPREQRTVLALQILQGTPAPKGDGDSAIIETFNPHQRFEEFEELEGDYG